jgi:hypothetical protein
VTPVLVVVHNALSTTEPRTASEICHALPLTLDTVESTLRELLVYGGARLTGDDVGVIYWVRVP